MKRFEVGIGLNHEVMTSFLLVKWPGHPNSEANLARVTVYGCIHMLLRQHNNSLHTLYMSDMDVWRDLRWVSASTMRLWHHFHSSSDPDIPNLWPTRPVLQYKGATICPWDSFPKLKSLNIYQNWMYEEVWGGYPPLPWGYDVIFTPQVTLTSKIWGQLGQYNSIRVEQYALETAYQWFKHFIYV